VKKGEKNGVKFFGKRISPGPLINGQRRTPLDYFRGEVRLIGVGGVSAVIWRKPGASQEALGGNVTTKIPRSGGCLKNRRDRPVPLKKTRRVWKRESQAAEQRAEAEKKGELQRPSTKGFTTLYCRKQVSKGGGEQVLESEAGRSRSLMKSRLTT